MTAALGQTIVFENKAGAGGTIGSDLVAKAPVDGRTLPMGTVGTHAINATLYRTGRSAAALDIVGLCGSLRVASYYRMAMKLAAECLPASMTLDLVGTTCARCCST